MNNPPNSTGRARAAGNHIAEWFGHRVYPMVAETEESLRDQRQQRCPFLSEITGKKHNCIKREKSRGVCTISSISNGPRQDWLVCPFRALDLDILNDAARRLFYHGGYPSTLNLVAATVLSDKAQADKFRSAVHAGVPSIVYFQNKLGGEISLGATERSPEFSFDATMIEVLPDGSKLSLGRYGIFEIQTMDFHGTYAKAVSNLKNALGMMNEGEFSEMIASHPQWVSEKVEGPNIANVFKRTFYQMMFKFQIGAHGQSAGCIFAIPTAVWDSWQRHLGKPELVHHGDGTFRLAQPEQENEEYPSSWIYVFDLDPSS